MILARRSNGSLWLIALKKSDADTLEAMKESRLQFPRINLAVKRHGANQSYVRTPRRSYFNGIDQLRSPPMPDIQNWMAASARIWSATKFSTHVECQ